MPSEEGELRLAKWLVAKSHLSKEQAQQALRHQANLVKQGQQVQLFQILLRMKLFDKPTLQNLHAQYRADREITRMAPPSEQAKAAKEDNAEETIILPPVSIRRRAVEPAIKVATVTKVAQCRECLMKIPAEARECPYCASTVAAFTITLCARCEHEVDANAKVCSFCGSHPHTGQPGSSTPHCRGCTKPILPDDALCRSCGTVVLDDAVHRGSAPMVAQLSLSLLMSFLLAGYAWSSFAQRQPGTPMPEMAQEQPLLEAFAEIDPERTAEWSPEGQAARQLELLNESIKFIREQSWHKVAEILEKEKNILNTELIELWAHSLYRSGNHHRAVALYKSYSHLPKLQALLTEISLQEARQLFEAGKMAEALATIQPAVESKNVDAETLFWAGVIAFAAGDASAGVHFEACLRLSDSWPQAHLFLAKLQAGETGRQHLEQFKNLKIKGAPYQKVLDHLEATP